MLLSTSKQRFQSFTENIAKHRRLIDDPQFEASVQAAMLQYAEELAHPSNKPKAAHHALVGAHRFVEILKNLAEPLPQMPKPPKMNLDHSH